MQVYDQSKMQAVCFAVLNTSHSPERQPFMIVYANPIFLVNHGNITG